MALQADEANVGAGQHPRVGRAMRFVTGLAAFKPHRRMFEREWPPLVAVALEAPRLIGREGLEHGWTDTAVRIVTIHAAHRAFRELVMEGPLELGPLIQVTAGAKLIRRVGLADQQRLALMHFVARRAGDLIVGVAAFEASDLGRLIQMTRETEFVGRGGRQVRRILNIAGGRSFRMRLAGPVTGLALAAHPSLLCVDSQRVMRVLGEPVIDVLVTDLAGVRPGVARRKRGPSRRADNSQEQDQ